MSELAKIYELWHKGGIVGKALATLGFIAFLITLLLNAKQLKEYVWPHVPVKKALISISKPSNLENLLIIF